MTLRILAACIVSTVLLAVAAPAGADTVITGIIPDTDNMTLRIEGFDLPQGDVYLGRNGGGAQRLKILSSSPRAVDAVLPSASPGTYAVALSRGAGQFYFGFVTIGATGPQGPAGDQGPQGIQGPPGISGYVRRVFSGFPATPGSANYIGTCGTGETIISGGWNEVALPPFRVISHGSYPSADGSWTSNLENTDSVQRNVDFYLICAVVAP